MQCARSYRLIPSACARPSKFSSEEHQRSTGCISRRLVTLTSPVLWACCTAPSEAKSGILPFFGQPQHQLAQPVRFPRSRLDLRFAVLMMHSVYEAVDRLNVVPTSTFQSTFWKRRQEEYEPYLEQYSPITVKQGDLTDPLYFDFISFAQILTVGDDILKNAPAQERPALLTSIQQHIGDLIFEGLRDGFREELFNGPPAMPSGTHIDKLAEGVQSILDIFVQKGFALKASVKDLAADCKEGSCDYHGAFGSRGRFTIRVEGPADLWGMNTAGMRGSQLQPDFIAFAVDGFLRASQATPSYSGSLQPAAITQKWLLA